MNFIEICKFFINIFLHNTFRNHYLCNLNYLEDIKCVLFSEKYKFKEKKNQFFFFQIVFPKVENLEILNKFSNYFLKYFNL